MCVMGRWVIGIPAMWGVRLCLCLEARRCDEGDSLMSRAGAGGRGDRANAREGDRGERSREIIVFCCATRCR